MPLLYFDYFGHVHPSLSFKRLAPHPWAVWPPPVWDSANAKQLPGESVWVATCCYHGFVGHSIGANYIKSYCMLTCFAYLEKNCQAKQIDCTNHKGGLMVHKFHEISTINVIIFCQYVTRKTLNFHQMECVPKCQTAHSCAKPCAHQTTHFW